jgi:predicted nucleic acid-binding protein
LPNVFLDTSFFVALANTSDRDHERMKALSDRVRSGEFGQPYTSDYVLDESVTTAFVRTAQIDRAIEVGRIILGNKAKEIPPIAKLIYVEQSTFNEAWDNFSSLKFEEKKLSFTDHTILVQMKDLGIKIVASMDSGFDGFVLRVF